MWSTCDIHPLYIGPRPEKTKDTAEPGSARSYKETWRIILISYLASDVFHTYILYSKGYEHTVIIQRMKVYNNIIIFSW